MSSMKCTLCPRQCRVDRTKTVGYCGIGADAVVARAALHFWEEPCISGEAGSGAVFFSGCNLGCVFCQNAEISHGGGGAAVSDAALGDIFLRLADEGACNINLVTAAPHLPHVLRALDRVRHRLNIPVVYNSGGYETTAALRSLKGYIDIYLPDLKYLDSKRAERFADAPDYPTVATAAIDEMVRQTGSYSLDENGLLKHGTLVRHLVLPGGRHEAMAVGGYLKHHYSPDLILVSVMSQYTPPSQPLADPVLNRRITAFEYESVCDCFRSLGFHGYFQERCAAGAQYTPHFDLTGVPQSAHPVIAPSNQGKAPSNQGKVTK